MHGHVGADRQRHRARAVVEGHGQAKGVGQAGHGAGDADAAAPADIHDRHRHRFALDQVAEGRQPAEGLAARDGLRDGVDVKAFRLMLIGALNATIEWFDPERGDLAGLADKYADIMLHGLLPQAE